MVDSGVGWAVLVLGGPFVYVSGRGRAATSRKRDERTTTYVSDRGRSTTSGRRDKGTTRSCWEGWRTMERVKDTSLGPEVEVPTRETTVR